MTYTEDHIALAAEYALGSLDADERAQVETMMAVDKEFAAVVQAWELHLGVLNQMVGSVEPRPVVWDNITAAIGQAKNPQEPQVLVTAAPTPPVLPKTLPQTAAVEDARRAKRWRNTASAAGVLATALLALQALQLYWPDMLPDAMRPAPLIQTAEVSPEVPPPPQPPPPSQDVALLQGPGGAPAFVLTIDKATRDIAVRKVNATLEPGKSFELWLMSDKLPGPRSLGVIGDSDFTARERLASYDADIINTATYAVSLEQAGGSPTGQPTWAPEFSGKLIEPVAQTSQPPADKSQTPQPPADK